VDHARHILRVDQAGVGRVVFDLDVFQRLRGDPGEVELFFHLVAGGPERCLGVEKHRGNHQARQAILCPMPDDRRRSLAPPRSRDDLGVRLAPRLPERGFQVVGMLTRRLLHRRIEVAAGIPGEQLLVSRCGMVAAEQALEPRASRPGRAARGSCHASSFETTFPLTSVSRKSRPWNL
jgi:hypothetical protein